MSFVQHVPESLDTGQTVKEMSENEKNDPVNNHFSIFAPYL
jgi:hypothetical protein